MTKPENRHLQTVLTALDVIEYLRKQDVPVRLTDISRALGLPKAQVHRILTTLALRQYVQQDPGTRRYYLGLHIWLIGRSVSPSRSLLDVAQDLLDQMSADVQETVFLSVLDSNTVVYLYAKDGQHPVRAVVSVGSRGPLHATATGKAMLAHQTQEYINTFLDSDLARFTPHTVVDRESILQDLDEIRRKGYAVTIDEWSVGLAGVGTPILDETSSRAFAAVGITFPTARATEERLIEMGEIAMRATREITRRLEHTPALSPDD